MKKVGVFLLILFMAVDAYAAPDLLNIGAGTAQISSTGSQLTINQQSNILDLNWRSFDVASDEIVNFVQPNASALAINRVQTNLFPTEIWGQIRSNGRIMLLNPRGVIFHNGSLIDTNDFMVSTNALLNAGEISNLSQLNFGGVGYGAPIIMDGDIRIKKNGSLLVDADYIQMNGSINGDHGSIRLITADQITIGIATGLSIINLNLSSGDIHLSNAAIASHHGDIDLISGNIISINNAHIDAGEGDMSLMTTSRADINDTVMQSTGGDINISASSDSNGRVYLNNSDLMTKGGNNVGAVLVNTSTWNIFASEDYFRGANSVESGVDNGGNIIIRAAELYGAGNCVIAGSPSGMCGTKINQMAFNVDSERIQNGQYQNAILVQTQNKSIKNMIKDNAISDSSEGSEITLSSDDDESGISNDEDEFY